MHVSGNYLVFESKKSIQNCLHSLRNDAQLYSKFSLHAKLLILLFFRCSVGVLLVAFYEEIALMVKSMFVVNLLI